VGLNVDWALKDSLSVALDSSWSRVTSGGANGTNVAVLGFRSNNDIFTLRYGPDGLPSVTGISNQDIVDPSLPRRISPYEAAVAARLEAGRI
jgi:hypothetical protein